MENCFGSGWDEAATGKDSSFLDPWPPLSESMPHQFEGYPQSSTVAFEEEDRGASSSRSHSQAEKRRRERINTQLSTLRKLIPKSDKMDKAALLGNVVEQVKELKRKAIEVSKISTVPTDTDQVTITDSDNSTIDINNNNTFIEACFCCNDRPELFADLNRALTELGLRMVRADMTCLGGRIKGVFVLCNKDEERSKEEVSIDDLKQSLKAVLSGIVTASNYRVHSKRQRFFLPSHYHT